MMGQQGGSHERRLFICFSLDKGFFKKTDANSLETYAETHIRHMIRDWFPEVVFGDLTDDTKRLDVVVRKGILTNRNVYGTSFYRADGSLIMKKDYDEDRLVGQTCVHHDKKADKFIGRIYGADVRLVVLK